MVKEVSLEIAIPGCCAQVRRLITHREGKGGCGHVRESVAGGREVSGQSNQRAILHGLHLQVFFDTVYSSACVKEFHRKFNQDEAAGVTDWVGGKRTVSFTTPVDAPPFLRRLIGAEVIPVVETQTFYVASGGAIVVKSAPVPEFKGADKFTTEATTTISNEASGCQVGAGAGSTRESTHVCPTAATSPGAQAVAVVACTAAGPYGLSGTIEGFMATTALKSMQQFWGFAKEYVAQRIASGELVAVEPAEPAAAAPAAVSPASAAAAGKEEADGELFCDAVEVSSLDLSRLEASGGTQFEGAALLLLKYVCKTGDQQVAVLQSLERRVAQVVAQLGDVQAEQQRQARAAWWLSWQLPATVSTRQALLLIAVASTASAAAALSWSERRQRR